MQNYQVITFNVGQGLFNLMIGRRDDGSLYTAVFDCGNFQEYQMTGIEEACGILNQIADFKMLDNVVISHQDVDHWRNFIDFMLLLNGHTYSEDAWYYLPELRCPFYWLKFTDHSLSQFRVILDVEVQHVIGYYIEEDYVLGRCYVAVPEDYQKSRWHLRFFVQRYELVFTISPSDTSSVYKVELSDRGKRKKDTAALDAVRNKCITMLADAGYVQNVTDRMYELLNGIFPLLEFEYDRFLSYCENADKIEKVIGNLYAGGMDCEFGYRIFKRIISNFTHCYNGDSCAYMKLLPDTNSVSDKEYSFSFERNIEKPVLKGAVYKNATSLITAVYVSQKDCLLFPGDATVHVFHALISRLTTGTNVKLLLAPHHGSLDTNFSFHKVPGTTIYEKDEKQPLYSLLQKFPPECIFISAHREKFGHPRASFLDLCGEFCRGDSEEHQILTGPDDWYQGYVFQDTDAYQTKKAVFSTESNEGNLCFDGTGLRNIQAKAQRNMERSVQANRTGGKTQVPPDDLFIPYGGFDL